MFTNETTCKRHNKILFKTWGKDALKIPSLAWISQATLCFQIEQCNTEKSASNPKHVHLCMIHTHTCAKFEPGQSEDCPVQTSDLSFAWTICSVAI